MFEKGIFMRAEIEPPLFIAEQLAEALGERLKQARLNLDMTQTEVANLAGVSRKIVISAEKGKVQLVSLLAIMTALNLTDNIHLFLPQPEISPIQLAKLQGKKRQRASGKKGNNEEKQSQW